MPRRSNKEYNILVEKDKDGYLVGTVLELRGCHSQAKTLDQLFTRMLEAIEVCEEDDQDSARDVEYVGVTRLNPSTWANLPG